MDIILVGAEENALPLDFDIEKVEPDPAVKKLLYQVALKNGWTMRETYWDWLKHCDAECTKRFRERLIERF